MIDDDIDTTIPWVRTTSVGVAVVPSVDMVEEGGERAESRPSL
jgi:hypothetical protein